MIKSESIPYIIIPGAIVSFDWSYMVRDQPSSTTRRITGHTTPGDPTMILASIKDDQDNITMLLSYFVLVQHNDLVGWIRLSPAGCPNTILLASSHHEKGGEA